MPFGGFQKQVSLGVWIQLHLMERGEDYIEGMWRAYRDELKEMPLSRPRKIVKTGMIRTRYKIPTYASFAKYFHALRALGLIEFVREEPADSRYPDAMPRRYYRIAAGQEYDPRWGNPHRWAYHS